GKLKILTGEPQHVGEYYLYLKVNGVLIQEAYSNAGDDGQFMSGNALCRMENKIRFGDWSSSDDNNRISAYDFEAFAPYDVVEYEDLLDTGDHHLSAEGTRLTAQNNLFHYEATSPSHSAIYKLRWIAGNDIYFQLHPGVYGSSNNFAYRINGTNWNQRNPSADVPIGYTINEGDHVDIEIGRLLVADGDNAGKYYTYFKAGKKVIFEKYVSADEANTANFLADSIQLNLRDASHYCDIGPVIEEIEEEPADALYYKYDEIGYGDLLLGGNYLGGETSIDGGKTFTYNKTSSTGSVILKYRWTAVEDAQFQVSFDTGKDGKVNYMFGVQLYKPGVEDHTNASVRLRPGLDAGAWVELDENVVGGQSYDIEFARLKVKNGDNAGKYYVYFKIDDKLISESYVNEGVVDSKGNYKSNPGDTDCHISNEIYMTAWGNSGNKISSVPGETAYYDYDEVYYGDLLYNDKPLAMETTMNGGRIFTYNKTSPTGSVILRYRWTAVEDTKFQISFDTANDKMDYMFGAQLYTPGSEGKEKSSIRLRPGYDDKNAWVELAENIVGGQDYDIEFARLKVKNGENTGKYYVYFMINGELIAESYVASNVVDGSGNYTSSPSSAACTISNRIYMTFWNASGNKISATPFPETYEQYDEIYYSDLMKSGKALPVGGTKLSGGNVFTYNRTSPTGSAILKYRWTVGTVSKFQLSFEKTSSSAMEYMFGAWLSEPGAEANYPNGRMWLRPGYGPQVGFDTAIEPGTDHDIELARLKVANGPNKGKYYVYIKIDGALIAEDYVMASIVDDNLNYYTKPNEDLQCSMTSNEIFLAFWGSENNYISEIPFEETYEAYDEIGYADLYKDGNPVPADGRTMSGATVFTYNRTSPTGSAIFKYRWTIGSVAKFQMSFEKTKSDAMAYMFGAWLAEPGAQEAYPNGKMWLRPGYGPEVALSTALAAGSSHNVEFARLKVANGPNKGKYYVYIKIDDALIAEDYVAAGTVDENLDYYSKPNEVLCSIPSNEIFFAFWGSEGNKLSAYKEAGINVHEGTRGDFDDNGLINTVDYDTLVRVLFGTADISKRPEGIADFNNDSGNDICDIIAMKKHIAPVNTYAKSGKLTVGTQEHLLEDETKTAAYIADASAVLGATSYRLSMPIHQLYYATETNGVGVKTDNMNSFKKMIAALKAKGIDEILYVTDSFILPYGYNDPENTHNKTVPDPIKDNVNYLAWLNVNAAAFAALAKECPEIKFFEPFNEINVTGSRLETYGIGWNATAEEQAAHRFTVAEKAGIMADLCWYVSRAVKSVDPANQVTTPSISLSNSSIVEKDFLDAFYKAIESGNYPAGQSLADKRIDNYFTIINIHLYPEHTDNSQNVATNVNSFAANINSAYDVIKAHNDGGSRVWLTETGVSTRNNNGTFRNEALTGTLLGATLSKIDNDLTYIDTVITYKLADISTDVGANWVETCYGLFYSGDDMDNVPYTAKPAAKAVYSFTHEGSTDYSELEALADRYAE
ncbi:MAG: cellulase family glycosylhydrolase, partial [Clostridia bacterium]|nr:cellulase family glycosylhydrolase [Clostridia bacterium]